MDISLPPLARLVRKYLCGRVDAVSWEHLDARPRFQNLGIDFLLPTELIHYESVSFNGMLAHLV